MIGWIITLSISKSSLQNSHICVKRIAYWPGFSDAAHFYGFDNQGFKVAGVIDLMIDPAFVFLHGSIGNRDGEIQKLVTDFMVGSSICFLDFGFPKKDLFFLQDSYDRILLFDFHRG